MAMRSQTGSPAELVPIFDRSSTALPIPTQTVRQHGWPPDAACVDLGQQYGPGVRQGRTPSLRGDRAAAAAQTDILQFGEHAGSDRLRDDHELAGQVRRHRAGEQ